MSHNNKSNNSSDNGGDRSPLSPFSYFILNQEWGKLRCQPKWKEKSTESLQIAVRKLSHVPPVISFYMMDYAIERGYDKIFDANDEVTKQANGKLSEFFEAETRSRSGRVNTVLSQLREISRDAIKIPPAENFVITPNGACIKCSAEFANWLEANGSETFPVLKQWTGNLRLTYNVLT